MLLAVSKASGKECSCLPHIALGLHGGLQSGEVCGALSGAVLAIGLLYGQEQPQAVPELAGQFMRRFADQHGAVRCADNVGFDMNSSKITARLRGLKGLLNFGLRGGKVVCEEVVAAAVELLLEQLEEWESRRSLPKGTL